MVKLSESFVSTVGSLSVITAVHCLTAALLPATVRCCVRVCVYRCTIVNTRAYLKWRGTYLNGYPTAPPPPLCVCVVCCIVRVIRSNLCVNIGGISVIVD